MSKHLLIGGAITLGSLLSLVLSLTAAAGAPAELPPDGGKLALKPRIIPADRALGPVRAQLATTSDGGINPFTMRPSGEVKTTRLPLPPPPQLALPALPVLPLTER